MSNLDLAQIVETSRTTGVYSFSTLGNEDMVRVGCALRESKDRYLFILCDWLVEMKKRHGPEHTLSLVVKIGFDADDIVIASQISLLPIDWRRRQLSDRHQRMFAWLLEQGHMPEGDIDKWTLLTIEQDLTDLDLKASVFAGHVVRSTENPAKGSNRSGFISIHGISATFTRWLKNVEVEKMSRPAKIQIIEETEPIVALNAKLKAEVLKGEVAA